MHGRRGGAIQAAVTAIGLLLSSEVRGGAAETDTLPLARTAALMAHASEVPVQERLVEALRSSRPEVRAVAARTIGSSNRSIFSQALATALLSETSLEAAAEEMRSLASLRGEASFPDLVAAGDRLGRDARVEAAIAMARATGAAALTPYFESFHAAFRSPMGAMPFFLWASRGHAEVAEGARLGLCRGDLQSFKATIRASYASEVVLDESLLLEALGSGIPEIATDAAWYLALSGADEPIFEWENRQGLVAALQRLEGFPEPDAPFGRELALRVLGEDPKEVEGWIAWVRNGGRTHAAEKPRLTARFLPRELRMLDSGNAAALRSVEPFERLHEKPPDREHPSPPEVQRLVFRTLGWFPKGLVAEVLRAEGCAAGSDNRAALVARVVFREDGRAALVRVIEAPDIKCLAAAKTLFPLVLARNDEPPFPNQSQILVLPLDPQLIAAIDREGSRSSGGTVNPGFSPPLTIPPREISRVKPVYPEEARLARWTGVVVLECVINREGRVNPVRVFRSTGTMQSYDDLPRSLELSALRAVTLWRYEPATVEGRPVPTSLTVSVTFRLK